MESKPLVHLPQHLPPPPAFSLEVPVVPVRPERVICAHSYHAKVNTSGGEFSGAVRCGEAIWEARLSDAGLCLRGGGMKD